MAIPFLQRVVASFWHGNDTPDLPAQILASPYLVQSCSSVVRNELNRLSVRLPHLRVISLLQGDQLTCSSFDVPMPRRMDISQYADNRLSLRPGSNIPPDAPHAVLLNAFPEGTVLVSIALQHLTETLSLLSAHTPLNLTVDIIRYIFLFY